jgi:hypothetical protein
VKEYLKFSSLEKAEQEWYLRNTWCESCGKADLGIEQPELYLENGEKYISGKCKVCLSLCISTIVE